MFTPESSWTPPAELPDLRHAGMRIAVDVENKDEGLAAGRGSSWPYRGGHICGLAVAWRGGKFYAPTRHPDTENIDEDCVRRWVEDHAKAGVRFITHHGSHDWGWMRSQWGILPPEARDDTEAQAMIADENRLNYKLDDLCRWRGVAGKNTVKLREGAAAFGFADNPAGNIWRMPARFAGEYAEDDAAALLDLADDLDRVIDAEGTRDAYQLEIDLVPMVQQMRWRGIRVDVGAAERGIESLETERDGVLADLAHRLGRARLTMSEVRSPRHMEQMFTAEGVPFPRTEKTRQGSFQALWMRKHEHWLPRLVARAEQLDEAANKFIRGFILDYAHRGRIHASINQYRGEEGGTRSYRFSYADPALQQMPSRDAFLTELIRGLFLPEDGELWLAADYSQQEYRLIVHFAVLLACERAAEAAQRYIDDPATDFHMMVSEMTGLERKPAKDTNFAKAFGAGVPKFAQMIGKSLDEARAIMEQYDEEMPFVRQLAQRCQSAAGERGYVRLIDGARSHFDQWEPAWMDQGDTWGTANSQEAARERWPGRRLKRAFIHKAMNRLIQGSAARQTKLWMRACWREGLVPLLQMHDELDFSVRDRAQGERVAELGRDVVQLRVPMKVDTEYGRTWGQAKLSWDEAVAT